MRRMEKLICLILLLSASLPACAGGVRERDFSRVTFGVEGSFAGAFLSYRHSNYISNYGYRIDRKTFRHNFHGNGEILLHVGCNISPCVNLSLYSGYSGACPEGRIFPFDLRLTWFPSEKTDKDRWFAFLDAGPALNRTGKVSTLAGTGKLGGGYRISITRSVKMDFLVSLRQVFLKDMHLKANIADNQYVDENKIRRNNTAYTAVTIGIGLTF